MIEPGRGVAYAILFSEIGLTLLVTTLVGVDSVTLYYRGHRGLSAEVLHFGSAGKVRAAFAHYSLEAQSPAAAKSKR